MTRKRKIILGVTLALSLGLILTIWRGVSPLLAEPTITTNYVAEFNEKIEQIPEEDRAWPLYVDAYGQIGLWPNDLTTVNDELREWVAAHTEAAELIRQAAARPHIGAPLSDVAAPEMIGAAAAHAGAPPPTDHPEPSENPMLLSVVLPQLGATRTFNRLLMAEALVAAEDGDGDLAAQNIAAMIGLARQARGYPILISDMVSFAAVQLASETLARCLVEDPDLFSPEALSRMRAAFADYSAGKPIMPRLEWERKQYLDLVQRIYSDDGSGDGLVTREGLALLKELTDHSFAADPVVPDGPLGDVDVWAYASRREVVEEYEELYELAQEHIARDPWNRDDTPLRRALDDLMNQDVQRKMTGALPDNPIIEFVNPHSALRAADQAAEATMWHSAALTLLALAHHRHDTGAWPQSLDTLVPTHLDAIGPDPADGAPLRYTLRDGEPLLYSIGPNRADDNATGDDEMLFPLPPAE